MFSSGVVTIAGGSTVNPLPLNLSRSAVDTYTIISSDNPLNVIDPFIVLNLLPHYRFSLQYTPTSVILHVDQILTYYASGNAGAAAKCYNTMLNDLPKDLLSLSDIFDVQTPEQWQVSFNQMQPANFNNLAYGQENVAERIRQIFSSHLYEQRSLSCIKPFEWQIWTAPFYEYARQSGSGSLQGYREQFEGVTLAGDYQFPDHWLMTTGFSYASSDVKMIDGQAQASFNAYGAILGARWSNQPGFADLLVSYQYSAIQGRRHMQFVADTPMLTAVDTRTATHNQGSHQVLGHVGGSYDVEFYKQDRASAKWYPFITIDYLYVLQNRYTEKGAESIDLKVHGKSTDLLRPEIGLGLCYDKCSEHLEFFCDLQASYVHECRFMGRHNTSSFTGSPCEFQTTGLLPQNDLICPTLRLIFSSPKTGVSGTLGYHGEYGAHFLENVGEAELRFPF